MRLSDFKKLEESVQEHTKKCKYRNCKLPISGPNRKLYCSKKCRSNESKYVYREKGRTDINI